MRMTRQAKFGVWAAAALVIAAASFFTGTLLKPGAEPNYVFETDAAACGEPSSVAATSQGGFTGFGETDGSDSRVVISGRVIDMTGTTITLESIRGQETKIDFGDSPRIFRLERGGSELLRNGVTVAVRLDDAGEAVESLLVLSQP